MTAFISSTGDYDLVLTAVALKGYKALGKLALESIIWQTSGFPFSQALLEQNQGQQCLKTSKEKNLSLAKLPLCASWIFQHGSGLAGAQILEEIFFSQFKRTVKHFIQIIPHQLLASETKRSLPVAARSFPMRQI